MVERAIPLFERSGGRVDDLPSGLSAASASVEKHPSLAARALVLGRNLFDLLNPLAVSPEELSRISRLDLRPSYTTIKVTRESRLPQQPEKPFPGQLALAGLEELVYVKEVVVPREQLHP